MTKYKHNKRRNSAFLYETAVLELTKAVLDNNKKLQNDIMALIKESFSVRTFMGYDLKLYKGLATTHNVNSLTAEKIINETKRRREEIDRKVLVNEQNKFIRRMKKLTPQDLFSNFVPDYKTLASISQIFNTTAPIKTKILLENELTKKMTSPLKEQKMVPIDNLVFKSFVKRFNDEYGGESLLTEQRHLLNTFIKAVSDDGIIELFTYLNEEVGRLKKEIKISINNPEFVEDGEMAHKVREILTLLESYKNKNVDKQMIEEVIKIQSLVHEMKKDGN